MTTAEEQVRHAEQGWIAIYLVGEQVERPELVVTLHAQEQAGIVALPERADDGGAVFHYAEERQYRLSSATAKRSYRKGQNGHPNNRLGQRGTTGGRGGSRRRTVCQACQ